MRYGSSKGGHSKHRVRTPKESDSAARRVRRNCCCAHVRLSAESAFNETAEYAT